MGMTKDTSPSRSLGQKVVFALLSILKDNGCELPGRDVGRLIGERCDFNEWEKGGSANDQKIGQARWERSTHWFSLGCVKAGYIIKKNGIWYLTPEGDDALKLGAEGLFESIIKKYREWKNGQISDKPDPENGDRLDGERSLTIDDIEQLSISGIENRIQSLNAYEFQDLVAALLRGMGYYTPFVAPRGKDGGIDIMAYRDPLGTSSPRIQAQVKHRESSATAQEIRQLMGLLQKEGDVGIFISTGGFTSDAKISARVSHIHVELLDLTRFIALWQEFYDKMKEEDKSLLPLKPVFFLATKE